MTFYEIPYRPRNFFQILRNERINVHLWDAQAVHQHRHDHFEIGYVLRGTATHVIDNYTYTLKPGDLFLVDQGIWHQYFNGERLELINLCFYPEVIDGSLFSVHSVNDIATSKQFHFVPDISQNYSRLVLHDTDGSIRLILEDVAREMEEKNNGYRSIVRGHLIRLLIYFLRESGQNSVCLSPTIHSVIRNLHSRYMENVSLLELCDNQYYSLNYLGKKFKEETGMNYKTYLQNYRLQKAVTLLTTTDYSVSEIARAVGYQNVPFFYKLFQKYYGTTPLHYRKNIRTYQEETV